MRNVENDCAHFGATILCRMFQVPGFISRAIAVCDCFVCEGVLQLYYTKFFSYNYEVKTCRNWSRRNGQQAVYDSFFHEEHFEFGSTQEIVPKLVAIKKGCSVDVSCIRYR